MAFPEYGCNEDYHNFTRKPAWFTRIGSVMPTKYPKFKAYVYFNEPSGSGACHSWPVNTTGASLAAYAALGKLPRFSYFHSSSAGLKAETTTTTSSQHQHVQAWYVVVPVVAIAAICAVVLLLVVLYQQRKRKLQVDPLNYALSADA